MAIRETVDTFHLCWLCKPKHERELYQLVKKSRPTVIVELGIESRERTDRLVRLAMRCSPTHELRYSGIDLFDARPPEQAPLKLKEMHQLLSGSGASIRLVPGDPLSALTRCANQLQDTQLLLVSAAQEAGSLEAAWKYVPRMLSSQAIVLRTPSGESAARFEPIPRDQWQALALAAESRRRAA